MPAGLLGASAFVWPSDLPNGIYFQIGIIAIMGLTAKNYILIIVFTREVMPKGMGIRCAIETAVKQRFRSVVMT